MPSYKEGGGSHHRVVALAELKKLVRHADLHPPATFYRALRELLRPLHENEPDFEGPEVLLPTRSTSHIAMFSPDFYDHEGVLIFTEKKPIYHGAVWTRLTTVSQAASAAEAERHRVKKTNRRQRHRLHKRDRVARKERRAIINMLRSILRICLNWYSIQEAEYAAHPEDGFHSFSTEI
ncbi:unnamed protein product [Peniophora sp. CBMAI 1063]|nr:unnamed protein product [Peniophora sp. CBMAI 1063]